MAKRFTSTDIWSEDWFLDMPNDYKLFWYYVLSNCDHAGIFKVNLRSFCSLLGIKIDSKKALEYFNSGKDRIREISQSLWLIEDFFCYQYGQNYNPNNRVHKSISDIYNKLGVNLTSIRGLIEVNDGVKDKDKDIDKDRVIKKPIDLLNERSKVFYNSIAEFKDNYSKEMLRKFYEYWIEPNKSKTRMRFELEKTWDLGLRLKKWANNNFDKIPVKKETVTPTYKNADEILKKYEK